MKRQKKPEETQQATISKLRAENRKLRKEKKVLQAENMRLMNLLAEFSGHIDVDDLEEEVETESSCQHCGSPDVDIIAAGIRKVWQCGNCGKKGVMK